jgi:3-isopropylmalate/(R)-2-methylmalate dehydratase small subunit
MESLTSVTGIAAPLMRANIDTDQIIPTRFLARLSEDGLGEGLFAEWAHRADGTPEPAFLLNQLPWSEAGILLAGPMFGCGSSREAAPRALRQRGFRAVIAPSFGDIFYNNCFRNGIVPVRLPQDIVQKLADTMTRRRDVANGQIVTVNLADCTVSVPATGEVHRFEVPPLLHRMLHEGLDEVALTQTLQPQIDHHRAHDRQRRPWAYLYL